MPYDSTDELPSQTKNYSERQKRAFKEAFNSAHSQGKDESSAFAIAHGAAKKVEKNFEIGRHDRQEQNYWEQAMRKLEKERDKQLNRFQKSDDELQVLTSVISANVSKAFKDRHGIWRNKLGQFADAPPKAKPVKPPEDLGYEGTPLRSQRVRSEAYRQADELLAPGKQEEKEQKREERQQERGLGFYTEGERRENRKLSDKNKKRLAVAGAIVGTALAAAIIGKHVQTRRAKFGSKALSDIADSVRFPDAGASKVEGLANDFRRYIEKAADLKGDGPKTTWDGGMKSWVSENNVSGPRGGKYTLGTFRKNVDSFKSQRNDIFRKLPDADTLGPGRKDLRIQRLKRAGFLAAALSSVAGGKELLDDDDDKDKRRTPDERERLERGRQRAKERRERRDAMYAAMASRYSSEYSDPEETRSADSSAPEDVSDETRTNVATDEEVVEGPDEDMLRFDGLMEEGVQDDTGRIDRAEAVAFLGRVNDAHRYLARKGLQNDQSARDELANSYGFADHDELLAAIQFLGRKVDAGRRQ